MPRTRRRTKEHPESGVTHGIQIKPTAETLLQRVEPLATDSEAQIRVDVDDARDWCARGIHPLAAHEVEELLSHLELGGDAVLDVGPVEARDELLRAPR